MDVGCFWGQDFWRLMTSEAYPDGVYAVDLVRRWDLGFRMEAHILNFNTNLQNFIDSWTSSPSSLHH